MEENNTSTPVNQVIIRDEKGRFVQGHSGNPAGKPAGTKDFATRLINKLLEYPELKDGTIADVDKYEFIIEKLLELASKGNILAIREVLDRLLGKPKESIQHSGNIGVLTYKEALQILEGKIDDSNTTPQLKEGQE